MKPIIFMSLLASLAAPIAHAATRFHNDFSSYPSGAVDCLYKADNSSGCNGATVTIMNACLCANGGNFVTNTAKCMAPNHSDDLSATYSVLKVNCQGTASGITVTSEQFLAAANSVISSSISLTSTGTATGTVVAESAQATGGTGTSNKSSSSTSTTTTTTAATTSAATSSSSSSSSHGLSSATVVGIGVGLGIAGLLAITSTALFLLRRRRKQKRTAAAAATATNLLGPQTDSDYLKPGSSAGWSPMSPMTASGMASWDPTQTTSPVPAAYLGNAGQWGAPPGYQYAGPHPVLGDVKSVNGVAAEMPAQTVVYELDSTVVERGAQEMPGSQELVHPRAREREELRARNEERGAF